ncbi:TRAP transporter large permease [Pusillimonas sp. ANT_WB101]|uniref:TRAP transporter large permease n=1 Tax=Pusillimonas sp. ANT_WB101 TaxID=2597356 RepID=UPI0011EF09E9|nr:TRAP transporter large permease [Pusillimonas sp. ANT_WB101]KAA0911410.1 TRAP transporter large permease [Pusillimonas sp. ANT_WB101]
MLGISLIALMLLFLFLGMPVAFSLGAAGAIGLFFYGGMDTVLGILGTVPYRSAASYALATIPMFILMAQFISASGIVDDVFTAAQRWLERLPGGLAITTIFASAAMAAMSGSSTASAATLSMMAVPQMVKRGYSRSLATGVVAVAGTLAIMIPPSIAFVLYGIITETSIGKLLIAGIIPGIITAAMYCIGIIAWSRVSPHSMPSSTNMYSWKERFSTLRNLWPFLILAVIVVGSMYAGLATPTEAAAFGAFGAFVIPLLMGRMSKDAFQTSILKTIESTTMIFAIIIGAMIFGYFLTITESTQNLIRYIGDLNVNRWVIMGLIVVLYLLLGCIMDQVAIILVTLPLVFPLVTSLGFDPIWFGVICTKTAEIGMATPPVGMNAYVVSATTKVPLEEVFRGAAPLIGIDLLTLLILLAFPALSTWLPSTMIQ